MKRLGIYFFFDKDGIADDYVFYFLDQLHSVCQEVCIVINGALTDNSHQKLQKYTHKLIQRENKGLDAEAIKAALASYSLADLQPFDELVVCNFTAFGPMYPFSEMFDSMAAKQCDLWGPYRWTVYLEKQHTFIHPLPSYFIVFRKNLFLDDTFQQYWRQLPPIHSYEDSVILHEHQMTSYFEKNGFKVGAYIDHQQFRPYWKILWPFYCAESLLQNYRCPLLKRRQFFIEDGHFTWGWNNLEIVHYLKQKGLYDISLIYKNICRTQPIHTLPRHNFNYQGLCRYIKSWLHYNPLKRAKNKYYLTTQQDFHQAFKGK